MGLEGLMHLRAVHRRRRRVHRVEQQRRLRDQQQLHLRRDVEPPGHGTRVVGSLLRTKLADETSPIVYGVPDNLAVYSDAGESFSVSATAGGGGRGGGGGGGGAPGGGRGGGPGARRPGAARPTIPTSSRAGLRTRART